MSTYRIYYVEREGKEPYIPFNVAPFRVSEQSREHINETDWEETYDGRDAITALTAFFRDHAKDKDVVRILEEDGDSRQVEENEEWDPDRTYIWVEEGKLMEYQGLDEATPGMVSCPLCDGTGEVAEAIAEDYEAAQGE